MKKITIVAVLVLLVLAVFIFKPTLMGRGAAVPLSIVPTGDTMKIPTDIACATIQDCVDYALSQDPKATNVQATCDKTCTFISEKMPIEVTP